jgi:hypothetical protein
MPSELVGIDYNPTLEDAEDHNNCSANYERGLFWTGEV